MEKIYSPDNFPATEPLDLDKYFKEYEAECNISKFTSNDVFENRKDILNKDFKLPFTLDDIKELEVLCTIDKLKVPEENAKLPLENVPRDHIIHETHSITQETRDLLTVKNKEKFNALTDELHIDLKTVEKLFVDNKDDLSHVKDIEPGSTFVNKILIFTPFNTLLKHRLTSESVKIQYEIEVLGTNTLLDLANAITCVSDSFIIKEVPHPQVDCTNLQDAKEKYPSRCFFIENVFYNDMSHSNAIDYSEPVRKWAKEMNIGDFRSESMEEVTISCLKPRLGYGYVYIHQGNCEHIISFSDARLVQNTDCLVLKKYPRIISMKRHTNFLCFICSENHSSWAIVDSDRLPVRKAFFCTKCCESYMFLDGKKIGKFQLYPLHTGALAGTSQEDRVEENENSWGYVDDRN